MGQFKGTKGGWKEDIGIDLIGRNDDLMQIIIYSKQVNTHNIAHVFGLSEKEVMCNAQLISCAPEMLEMLIKMKNNDDWQIEDYIELEQLIKKATCTDK